MAGSRGVLGAGGGFGTGLLLLVGGLVVKHAQANMLAECSTGLGQLGQAFDPNAASECSSARDLSSLATGGIWIGAIMLVFAVGGFIIFLIAVGADAAGKRPKTAVAPAGSALAAGPGPAPTRAHAGAGAVSAPGVPLDVWQRGSLPDHPAGQGCGHELVPGARFCGVCGRPLTAADGRPAAL